MGFSRAPLLEPEVEVELATAMLKPWADGLSAKAIADKLGFGSTHTHFAKLQPRHIFSYRIKFNEGGVSEKTKHLRRFKHAFTARQTRYGKHIGIAKGEYRYKVEPGRVLTFPEFRDALNEAVPIVHTEDEYYSKYVARKRALLILHFWTPLRRSEVIERVRKDFSYEQGFLKIDLYRKKKRYRRNEQGKILAKTEPFFAALDLPLMHEVVDWIDKFDENEKPFDISGGTSWRYCKDVFPDMCVHAFRFSWITGAVNNAKSPGEILSTLLQDTGLSLDVLSVYIKSNARFRGVVNQTTLELIENAMKNA